MPNREFLMLAGTYKDEDVRGWFVSEKLDGQRCFWDGGVSRGTQKRLVPWANNDRDARYVSEPMATGLWSRYGNVIHAPDWWLDRLPKGLFLDGELYIGPGQFQETRSIVSRLVGTDDWARIKYHVFESPPKEAIFRGDKINNPNYSKLINQDQCLDFVDGRADGLYRSFEDLVRLGERGTQFLEQVRLPNEHDACKEQLRLMLHAVMAKGGEGLMLRNPISFWQPKRVKNLLKVKPLLVDEGTVVGYKWGEEGKLLGMMGALTVSYEGKTFNLSGFTDAERMMVDPSKNDAACVGKRCPGEDVASLFENPLFKRSSLVRFTYTGLTNEGVPREARYYREQA